VLERGYEGHVAKDNDSPYVGGGADARLAKGESGGLDAHRGSMAAANRHRGSRLSLMGDDVGDGTPLEPGVP
jgi:hypothetical protein